MAKKKGNKYSEERQESRAEKKREKMDPFAEAREATHKTKRGKTAKKG